MQETHSHSPGVTGVLLEGEPEDGESLAGDGVEHGAHDVVCEAVLLVVVHQHHLVPVLAHLLQAEGVADVHQVQDILLEARTAVAHRGLQELVACS